MYYTPKVLLQFKQGVYLDQWFYLDQGFYLEAFILTKGISKGYSKTNFYPLVPGLTEER